VQNPSTNVDIKFVEDNKLRVGNPIIASTSNSVLHVTGVGGADTFASTTHSSLETITQLGSWSTSRLGKNRRGEELRKLEFVRLLDMSKARRRIDRGSSDSSEGSPRIRRMEASRK
jgi:hypothetical protein